MDDVGPDLALAALDELLDLLEKGVDQSGTAVGGERVAAGVADVDPVADGPSRRQLPREGLLRA